MSQPPKTRSFTSAKGTKSLIIGTRLSVRFPRRIVPIWVSDPKGLAPCVRMASTPAINVVATEPIQGMSTPSLPWGEAIFVPFLITVIGSPVLEMCVERERPSKTVVNDAMNVGDLQLQSRLGGPREAQRRGERNAHDTDCADERRSPGNGAQTNAEHAMQRETRKRLASIFLQSNMVSEQSSP